MTVATNQRDRILDTALTLMSDQGARATSMRQLAKACDLNVAGIYHYFPSKADLLRSVIEERQYEVMLQEVPDIDVDLPPRQLLEVLIVEMWRGASDEEKIWQLLLGEGLRGDETALAMGHELLEAIERSLQLWLEHLFPGHLDRTATIADLIISQLFSFFIERLFRPDWSTDHVAQRASRIAAMAFPDDD